MYGQTSLTREEIRRITAAKKFPLGTRGVADDGRVFRYCRAAMAITKGDPLVSQVYAIGTGATWNIATDTSQGSHVPTATFGNIKFCTTGGMNDSFASTSELQDGYLYVAVGANAGDIIGIKSNSTCGTDCGDVTVYFKDDERLTETISDTAVIFLVRSPFDDVRVLWSATDYDAATQTSTGLETGITNKGAPVGVACVDVTKDNYFWAQTWGLAVVLADGTWVEGNMLFPTTTTATYNANTTVVGIGPLATATQGNLIAAQSQRPAFGWAVTPTASGQYGLVFLTVAP